jgi:hypothetical protein
MSFEAHRNLKAQVMETAREVGHVKFCAYVMLHDVARNQKLRYCVNEPDKEESGRAMFPVLMSTMWKGRRKGKTAVEDYGLCFRPTTVKEAKHQAEYDGLAKRLHGYLDCIVRNEA